MRLCVRICGQRPFWGVDSETQQEGETLMAQRLTVHSSAVLRHCLEHPARGYAWSVRELAEALGTTRNIIGKLRSGERRTVDPLLGAKLAEAFGVHQNVLFVPAVSTNSHNTRVFPSGGPS